MKDTYKTIKELLKNKRYRALVILGLYLVFMSIIVMAIRNAPTNEITIDNRLAEFKLKTNYNYNYSIITTNDDIEETKLILGSRFDNKNQLIFEEKTYVFDNVLIGFPINQIDITKLQYDYIYEYIKLATLTNADDISNNYSISLSSFMRIANRVSITSNDPITIKVFFTNNVITQIELDLTSYVNYNQDLYDKYMVVINYTNIGNVVDF
jgi:hypothetical protein